MKGLRIVVFLCTIVARVLAENSAKSYPQHIALELQGIEVRQALHILAKYTPFNLVLDNTVQGKLTLHLKKMTVEESIDTILRTQGLVKQLIGKTWVIKKGENLSEKESKFLETTCFKLQHRSAKDIVKLFLHHHGKQQPLENVFSVDECSNRLWMQDTPERVQRMKSLIQAFDQPIEQVLIEARIVSVNRNFSHKLGSHLKLQPLQQETQALEDSQTLQSTTNVRENDHTASRSLHPILNIDLPLLENSMSLNIPLIGKGLSQILDLELSAMESEGKIQVIAKPHLMTTNRNTATIATGFELSYQEKSRYGNTSLSFKKAVLSLKVTPEVTSENRLFLNLDINHDKPSTMQSQAGLAIDTQTLQTKVGIKSGETVVLGGVYVTTKEEKIQRTPLLGKIPILKFFFRKYHQEEAIHELMIFVTPHIIRNN